MNPEENSGAVGVLKIPYSIKKEQEQSDIKRKMIKKNRRKDFILANYQRIELELKKYNIKINAGSKSYSTKELS